MGRIIAFAINKGGSRRTTTVVQLAFQFAARGMRTLVVDLDSQANATECLTQTTAHDRSILDFFAPDPDPAVNIAEFCELTPVRMDPAIARNIDLIPCHASMVDRTIASAFKTPDDEFMDKLYDRVYNVSGPTTVTDVAAATLAVAGGRLPDPAWGGVHAALRTFAEPYDIALIDCPPALDIHTELALCAAHEVIVPVGMLPFMTRGYRLVEDMIGRLRANEHLAARYPDAPVDCRISGIVVTDYDARTKIQQETYKRLRRDRPGLVFTTPIRRNVAVAEAMFFGRPLAEYDPKSHGAADYAALAQEVLDRG